MNTRNAETVDTLHTHTHTHYVYKLLEMLRMCRSLKTAAVLARKNEKISLQTSKLYIIYRELKVDFFKKGRELDWG